MQDRIIDTATTLFLAQGFGATSIEAVADRAGIAKRTFYHRFRDKADLFVAVVRRLIERWLVPFDAELEEPRTAEELLLGSARRILSIALSAEALALHRLVLAEAQRFPELARIMSESGASKGVERIAAVLEREAAAGRLSVVDSRFAAEQFLSMVLGVPQRRALGLGEPLDPRELDLWARRTVELFLNGCRGNRPAAEATARPPHDAHRG